MQRSLEQIDVERENNRKRALEAEAELAEAKKDITKNTTYIFRLETELARLQSDLVLRDAEVRAVGSEMLVLQAECIRLREALEKIKEVVKHIPEVSTEDEVTIEHDYALSAIANILRDALAGTHDVQETPCTCGQVGCTLKRPVKRNEQESQCAEWEIEAIEGHRHRCRACWWEPIHGERGEDAIEAVRKHIQMQHLGQSDTEW
jgi:hypothetical protein